MESTHSVGQLAAHLGLDLLAVALLTFGIFSPRHRGRDLVPAYLALNVALFAVVAALGEAGGGSGLALGFGLFGVLSIVRLRSDALRHQEVAYYVVTLVLGLLCGLRALGLDAVHADEDALRAELARRLGRPYAWTVREIDYVRDLMVLEVHFRQTEVREQWAAPVRPSRSTTKTAAPSSQETV
ncbi:DUF4956 domain-containing protein [Streptomyces sp. cg35]|uniref:DUF4956 domain-containing protein n=1 Tax=Streptomyces sp. cg35 TaxID=3421650 RepID=UPI003D16EEC6